jgi:hypothetical protein
MKAVGLDHRILWRVCQTLKPFSPIKEISMTFDLIPLRIPAWALEKASLAAKEGQRQRREKPSYSRVPPLVPEHPAYKTLTPAFGHCLHPWNVNEINSNTANHKNRNTRDGFQNTEKKIASIEKGAREGRNTMVVS